MSRQPPHFDDALNYLIGQIAKVPEAAPGQANARQQRGHGSDIWIDHVSAEYWRGLGQSLEGMDQDGKEPYVSPFYDAAWELSRRGVLRPAAAVPDGQSSANHIGQRVNASPFFGDGFSLTAWGRGWVRAAVAERAFLPSSPGRTTQVLHEFAQRFGAGYAQRAAEAVADWQSGNYLSACTMAGAAAESILLATAIAKSKDEAAVMKTYRGGGGRGRVINDVAATAQKAAAERFKLSLQILSYWRDDAAHGVASSIGEVEAHEAILGLLRLARTTSDNWTALTT